MKKGLIALIAVAAVILISVGIYIAVGQKSTKKIKTYDEISYTEFMSKLENDESFVLLIGSATCSHCVAFKPTLEKFIQEYQIDVKYIDASKLTEKEYAILENRTKVSGTPTIVFIKEGVVLTRPKSVGEQSTSALVKIFKSAGYIE